MKKKYYILLLLSCLSFLSAQSQEVKVIRMTETIDFIPAADQRRDLNKDLCALVKIQVVDEITEVEGNVLGDIVIHGVEKWVYMAKGSRNMKIHFKNNLPLRIRFQDYKIGGLKSNRVYELVLEVPNAPAASTPAGNAKGNSLHMQVKPNFATVTIWGDNMQRQVYRPQENGMMSIYLPYGRYSYRAEAAGYEATEGTVFVDDANDVKNVTLPPIMGSLTINCPTDRADFYLNGERLIKGSKAKSWTGQVAPGDYIIQVKRKGYLDQSKSIRVVARQSQTVQIDRLLTAAEMKKAERNKARNEEKAAKAKVQEAQRQQRAAEQQKRNAERKEKYVARDRKLAAKNKRPVVWGVKAGYNMATTKFDGDPKTKSVSGFHVGVTSEIRMSDLLFLNTGLLYSQKGYKLEEYGIYEEANPQYLDIPLQLSLRLPLGKVVKLQLNAGPYLGLCIGGKVSDTYSSSYKLYDESFSSAYSGFDYGCQFGLGFDIAYHIHFDAAYQLGMEKKYQNRNLMFSIGYRF